MWHSHAAPPSVIILQIHSGRCKFEIPILILELCSLLSVHIGECAYFKESPLPDIRDT